MLRRAANARCAGARTRGQRKGGGGRGHTNAGGRAPSRRAALRAPRPLASLALADAGRPAVAPTQAAARGELRDTPALVQEVLDADLKPTGEKKTYTWQQYYDASKAMARALASIGLERFESVNVLGFNAPEWLVSNMGAMMAGGICAGIYTTNGPEACKYITEHSRARVVVLDGAKQLEKYVDTAKELDSIKALVVYDSAKGEAGAARAVAKFKAANPDPGAAVYTYEEFLCLGSNPVDGSKKKWDAAVDERIAAAQPGECCLLIYTSGTTGNPKAVMVSHDNAMFSIHAGMNQHAVFMDRDIDLRVVSYLPLSHIAAQHADVHAPIYCAGHLGRKATTYFARPDALKGSLKETLLLARPTIFFGVPRVWTKFMEKMVALGKKAPKPVQLLSKWAKSVGLEAYQARAAGRVPYKGCAWTVAEKIVFNTAKKKLGLDACVLFVSGAAPIATEVLAYFGSLDIHVVEVYGMSENTGVMTVGTMDKVRPGTCGTPVDGTELRIDHVPGRDKEGEGEVCVRGRHVMLGYMYDAEKTRATIDDNGFLHSGDVGRIDPKTGALSITGRIKELIITEGGENIAPVPIEDAIKTELPAISKVMIIGDKRKYLTCLITLVQEGSDQEGYSEVLDGVSKSLDYKCVTAAEAASSAKWKAYIEAGIKKYNSSSLVVSNACKVQKFSILPIDFSIETGELGPTTKLVRGKIVEKFATEIDAMYA